MESQLEETPDEVIEIEDEVIEIEDKPKHKRNYVLTEARKAALQKAREKKTDYAKVGREVVKKGNKKVVEKQEEPIVIEDDIEDEMEEEVVVPPKRTIVKKRIPTPPPQDDEEEMYESHQRLKEDEIRDYLRYKKQEEDNSICNCVMF